MTKEDMILQFEINRRNFIHLIENALFLNLLTLQHGHEAVNAKWNTLRVLKRTVPQTMQTIADVYPPAPPVSTPTVQTPTVAHLFSNVPSILNTDVASRSTTC
mmetsp:Transcript_20726/g.26782  ORF Transcript_20726/g.26782 Transcript_20726/m.26782 type:complete len:103 (+) Transcript_20726:141-449(+)